jgi:hypothetical protein
MPQPTIEDCKQNNGIDCAQEVDTELRAEAIQHRGHVIHQMRSMQWREAERISLPRSDEGRRELQRATLRWIERIAAIRPVPFRCG